MSAPALAPRPTPTRPTSPVRRAAPARPAARSTSARSTTTRSTTARTTPARGSSVPVQTARGASARAGGSRAAAAVQGSSALALQAPDRAGQRAGHGATRVRVVERPELGARRIGFAVSCTALLGALMLGLLLLNVAISGNAFTISDLQSQRSLLVDQQQSLEQQLLLENSPASLAARARALGMVPAQQVLVLAPDGTGAAPVPAAP